MKYGLLLGALLLASCGPQPVPCQSHCDCKSTEAPVKCPGEWVCGAQSLCEYQCASPCDTGAPYTCRDGEDCNGSICSSKLACVP